MDPLENSGSIQALLARENHDTHAATSQLAFHREAALVDEWETKIVVVGLPLNMDGSKGEMAKKYESEAKVLGDTLDVPVVLYDERLTTVTAERSLMEQEMKADARRLVVDKVAAAVMLQAWLDGGMPR